MTKMPAEHKTTKDAHKEVVEGVMQSVANQLADEMGVPSPQVTLLPSIVTPEPMVSGATLAAEYLSDLETLRYWLQSHMRNYRFTHDEKEAEALIGRLKAFVTHGAA